MNTYQDQQETQDSPTCVGNARDSSASWDRDNWPFITPDDLRALLTEKPMLSPLFPEILRDPIWDWDDQLWEFIRPVDLRELLQEDELDIEPVGLDALFGPSYEKEYNALPAEEREMLDRFATFFSSCPVCSTSNDEDYIRKFWFSKKKVDVSLKAALIELINNNLDFSSIWTDLVIGIPCCDCFKKIFNIG